MFIQNIVFTITIKFIVSTSLNQPENINLLLNHTTADHIPWSLLVRCDTICSAGKRGRSVAHMIPATRVKPRTEEYLLCASSRNLLGADLDTLRRRAILHDRPRRRSMLSLLKANASKRCKCGNIAYSPKLESFGQHNFQMLQMARMMVFFFSTWLQL